MTFSITDSGSALTITHEGEAGPVDLVTYVYLPTDVQLESPRPYFHPISSTAGDVVSLYRPHDHVWHKGIAWSLPNVGPHNFWGGPTFIRDQGYQQLNNDGSMRHVRFTEQTVTERFVKVAQELVWVTEQGQEVITENRVFTVSLLDPQTWALTFHTTMTNIADIALPLGSPTTAGRENAGYGGLFWRGPRSFTDGTILGPGHEGGEEVRGQRFPWMGFSGTHDETASQSTLIMVDHPENPRGPSSPGQDPEWFVRNEHFAGLCATPFFSEEIPFDPSDMVSFNYGVVIAQGGSNATRGQELADRGLGMLDHALKNL